MLSIHESWARGRHGLAGEYFGKSKVKEKGEKRLLRGSSFLEAGAEDNYQ